MFEQSFCSIDAAFQDPYAGDAPSPGCGDAVSAREARKEERRKIRRMQRMQQAPRPPVPAMNPFSAAASAEHPDQQDGYMNSIEPNAWLHNRNQAQNQKDQERSGGVNRSSPVFHDDPLDAYVKNEEREHVMVVPVGDATSSNASIARPKSFFGASGPEEEVYLTSPFAPSAANETVAASENYADYVADRQDYNLEPSFQQEEEVSGLGKAGSGAYPPTVDMYWKPRMPNGAHTAYVHPTRSLVRESLAPPKYYSESQHGYGHRQSSGSDDLTLEDMKRRIDSLVARLDDLHQPSPEQATSELLMFISTGIFVMFAMDMLVKRGGRMRF